MERLHTTALIRIHLREQARTFTTIACVMHQSNIFLSMGARTRNRYHMVKRDDMLPQNRFSTDVARQIFVPFIDTPITDIFSTENTQGSSTFPSSRLSITHQARITVLKRFNCAIRYCLTTTIKILTLFRNPFLIMFQVYPLIPYLDACLTDRIILILFVFMGLSFIELLNVFFFVARIAYLDERKVNLLILFGIEWTPTEAAPGMMPHLVAVEVPKRPLCLAFTAQFTRLWWSFLLFNQAYSNPISTLSAPSGIFTLSALIFPLMKGVKWFFIAADTTSFRGGGLIGMVGFRHSNEPPMQVCCLEMQSVTSPLHFEHLFSILPQICSQSQFRVPFMLYAEVS